MSLSSVHTRTTFPARNTRGTWAGAAIPVATLPSKFRSQVMAARFTHPSVGRRNRSLHVLAGTKVRELDAKQQEISARGLQLPVYESETIQKGVADLKDIMGSRAAAATEQELAWFVKTRKMNLEEAQEKLQRYLDWRETGFRNISWDDPSVAKEKSTGKAYLRDECDSLGRPVVVVKVPLQVVSDRDLEATKKLCVALMDEALERMEASEYMDEAVLCIFDLRGFGPKNADIAFLTFFVDIIFKYFPKRISQVLLIEPPFIFNPVWAVVKPLMGKYASMVRNVKAKELEDYIGTTSI